MPFLAWQVNDSNIDKFITWKREFPLVHIISDGSTTNDNRLGAVACIHLVVKQAAIVDDLMVIAGYAVHHYIRQLMCCCRDTLFYQDFSLTEFIKSFDHLQLTHPQGCSLLTYYNCPDEGQ